MDMKEWSNFMVRELCSRTVAKTGTSVVAPALPVKRGFERSRCIVGRKEGRKGGGRGGKALNWNPARARMIEPRVRTLKSLLPVRSDTFLLFFVLTWGLGG